MLFPASTLALAISVALPGIASAQSFIDYPQGGVTLKNGWSTLGNRKTPSRCVEGDKVTDPGQVTDVDFSEVTDTSSLMDSFNISASAKVSGIGAGATASVKFSKEVHLSTTGTNIAVRVLTLRGATYVVPVGSSETVKAAIANKRSIAPITQRPTDEDLSTSSIHLTRTAREWAHSDPWRFRLECGDSYVAAAIEATGINGVVAADTHDSSEKTAIEASVSGNYGSVSASAATGQVVQSMAAQNKIHISYHQTGGISATATTIDSFLTLVQQIGSTAPPSTGTPSLVEIRPYTELADYTPNPEFLPVEKMVNEYFRLYTLRDLTNVVIVNPNLFIFDAFVTLPSVAALGTKVQSDMNTLYSAISDCTKPRARKEPVVCAYPNSVPENDYIYRAHLPLSKEDGQAWRDRQVELQNLKNLQATLASTPATVSVYVCTWSGPTSCWNGHYENRVNRVYTTIQKNIADLQAQIAKEPEVFDDEEKRFKVFVANPAQTRCLGHVENNGCIVGQELNDLRAVVGTLYQ